MFLVIDKLKLKSFHENSTFLFFITLSFFLSNQIAFKCKETNDRCDLNIALEKATIAVASLWMLICFNVTALKEKRRNNKRKQKRVETIRNDELLMCFSFFVLNNSSRRLFSHMPPLPPRCRRSARTLSTRWSS